MVHKIARLRAKKGFTLIEMIVVIIIIGVLTAMIVPSLTYDQKPALGKALAKDVYYNAQDVLSTIEITNPSAIPSTGGKSFVVFYAALDNQGQVIKGGSGVANPVVGSAGKVHTAAVSTTSFDTLIADASKTDAQKKMYSKMQTALEKYTTQKEGMEGTIYIVTDETYRVLATYWLNVDANGLDVTLQDNCILASGDYCCSYPVMFCDAGQIFINSAENSVVEKPEESSESSEPSGT